MDITTMSIEDYDEAASLWRSMDEVGLDEDIDSREGTMDRISGKKPAGKIQPTS
jgi:hypothetical protein